MKPKQYTPMTLRQWCRSYQNGDFKNNILEAGWFDWLGSEDFLPDKTDKLARVLIAIQGTKQFGVNMYVSLKSTDSYDSVILTNSEESLVVEIVLIGDKWDAYYNAYNEDGTAILNYCARNKTFEEIVNVLMDD